MEKEKYLVEEPTWINSEGIGIKYSFYKSGWGEDTWHNEIGISTNETGISLTVNESINKGKGYRSFEVKLDYIQAKILVSTIKHHLEQLK